MYLPISNASNAKRQSEKSQGYSGSHLLRLEDQSSYPGNKKAHDNEIRMSNTLDKRKAHDIFNSTKR